MDINKLQTPCYILDEQDFVNNIKSFDNALKAKFPKHIIGYSVKTNSLPYVLKLAKDNGCYAEVVSYHEYALALKVGFQPQHIIYNGPMKSKETFLKAVTDGAIVNIETWREIEWLKELPRDKNYKVGIRINFDISNLSPTDDDNFDSRFGFSVESCDFVVALKRLSSMPNITLSGLHTHRHSQTRSLSFYQHITNATASIIEHFKLSLEYFDIGGGFFGPMPGKPTFEQYVETLSSSLSKTLKGICLIVEPGNALIASSFSYLVSVIDVKNHNNKLYVTTDGTRNDIDPTFHKSDYFKEFIYQSSTDCKVKETQVVCGMTCLENDRMFTVMPNNKPLLAGDHILFNRVGAYTLTLTPLFIHFFPIVYCKNQSGSVSVIRREWNENEIVANSEY